MVHRLALLIMILPAVLALRGLELGGGTPMIPVVPQESVAALLEMAKDETVAAKVEDAEGQGGLQELPASLLQALENGADPNEVLPSGGGDCTASADCHDGTCDNGRCANCPDSVVGSYCEYLLPEKYRSSERFAKFFRILRKGTCDASHLCNNGGRCDASGLCVCPSGLGGDYCDVCVDSTGCAPGTCTASKCVCPVGFSGPFCQTTCSADADCGKSGTCSSGKCTCPAGLSGPHCETGACDTTHPCPGGAVCVDAICQASTTACQGGCLNAGVCTANQCVCGEGFYGDRCQNLIGLCGSTALLTLETDNGCVIEPEFAPDVFAYSCAVDSAIDSIQVAATAADAATTDIAFSAEFENVQYGATNAKVSVNCKGKTDGGSVYAVTVYRAFPEATCDHKQANTCGDVVDEFCAAKTDCCATCLDGLCVAGHVEGGVCSLPDVTLSSLEANNGCNVKIKKFQASTPLDHKCIVLPEVDSIIVTATATDAKAKLEISGQDDIVDNLDNVVAITVTNQNEWSGRISRTYTINVDKAIATCSGVPHECDRVFDKLCGTTPTTNLAADCCVACDSIKKECVPGFATVMGTCSMIMADCAALRNIRLDNGCNIMFDPDVQEYSCSVPNAIVKVNVHTDQLFPRTIVEVVGNDGLRAGEDNLVRIVVKGVCTDTSISDKTYSVIVRRAASELTPTELRIQALEQKLAELASEPNTAEGPLHVYVHKNDAAPAAPVDVSDNGIHRRYENPGYSYDPNNQGGVVEPAYATDLPKGGVPPSAPGEPEHIIGPVEFATNLPVGGTTPSSTAF